MIDVISKAKTILILKHPFFASLLLGMPMIEDPSIPTVGTNGKEMRYNPEWLGSMPTQEVVFVLAHEVLHAALEHPLRLGNKHAMKYNIAADFIINKILIDDNVGIAPKGALHNPKLVEKGKGTTEGVYALLPDPTPNQGPGQEGGPLDSVEKAQGTQAEQAAQAADMRVKVAQAANAARVCGKLSKNLERFVSDMLRGSVDWKSVLRRFITERAKTDWSFARPKRRFLADDICLPSLTGERLGEIVVAVDCSGSVDANLLQLFANEVRGITQDTAPLMLHIVYFDSQVLRHDQFGPDNEFYIKPCGGGGTAFSPIWEYLNKKGVNPVACIVLTDLQCNDFGLVPEYPLLWATTDQTEAPFGEILKIAA